MAAAGGIKLQVWVKTRHCAFCSLSSLPPQLSAFTLLYKSQRCLALSPMIAFIEKCFLTKENVNGNRYDDNVDMIPDLPFTVPEHSCLAPL